MRNIKFNQLKNQVSYEEFCNQLLKDNLEVTFNPSSSEVSKKSLNALEEKLVALEKTLESLDRSDESITMMTVDNTYLENQLAPDLLSIREELEGMDVGSVEVKLIIPKFLFSKIILSKDKPNVSLVISENTSLDIHDITK